MTKLAMFEEYNKKDLEIANFYRRDYVGLGLILNLVLITLGYALVLGIIIIIRFDYITENFYRIDVQDILMPAVIGYIVVIALYSLIVFITRRMRHANASRRVEKYYDKLNKLSDIYDAEASRGRNGGRRQ